MIEERDACAAFWNSWLTTQDARRSRDVAAFASAWRRFHAWYGSQAKLARS
jgi:hypothetical protein